ncbi:septation protein SepH [Arthrobacter burdickii]|uniref:Septation protein SepH n=1 Tax=Arthrobacter burdickii TaxID=3035920 RepID=A0ABT8K3H2_9MICC|nr:septation protein SepH [Arthrobacter burdickii]MDN4611993.1 septation protein SepH [Arthrobacter burdickii]
MQELRLVGVDGEHLLLSGEQGTSYRLPIDDELRAASTTAGPEAPAPAVPEEPRRKPPKPPVHLTPRDIQARIRSGATAEQVAAESGLDLAHVQRYEGPVRAERDYVAYLAQRVEVASPLPSHDGYRSAFGDSPALLGDMVAFRVQSYGVDLGSLEWDSWRRPDGSWHVEASFDLPEGSKVDLGEQPPAQWTYNPTRKTVTNGNRWAQVLSELEPLDTPLPSRRLSAVADRVFDFEAEKAAEAPDGTPADQDGLLDVLRSRRGQRLGADEEGDDALAALLSRGGIPAAHPRDEDATGQDGAEDQDDPVHGLALAPSSAIGSAGRDDDSGNDDSDGGLDAGADGDVLEGAAPDETHHDDGTPRLYDGVSTETREISIFAQPTRRLQPPAAARQGADAGVSGGGSRPAGRNSGKDTSGSSSRDTGADSGTETGKGAEASPERRVKPKRSSVPSWDDIVFGRKGE